MAFSESLEFGNSTFMKLESQERRAVALGSQEEQKLPGMDIIEESPPVKNRLVSLSNTRSRFLLQNNNLSSNRSQRHCFRRSKSDSTIPPPEARTAAKSNNNYSEFFLSNITFSVEGRVQKEASDLRVSQIEAAFENTEDAKELEDEVSCSALDVPIFSEDVQQLLCTKDLDEMWQDSLRLSAQSEDSSLAELNGAVAIVGVPVLKDVATVEQKTPESMDELPILDESSFICTPHNKEELLEELQRSRILVTRAHATLPMIPVPFDEKHKSRHFNTSFKLQQQIDNTTVASKNTVKTQLCQLPVNELESLKYISAWNLPHGILQEYEKKGVIKMFDWQIECLNNPKLLLEHCNLVYSAPTSAGKTLVSEILLLKTVLERGKKVLLILPFISVVREKMCYLQDLLTTAGYRVEGFFGGYTPPGGFDSINVAICTIEKANSIVNKLLEQGKLAEVGTVVVDEVHLISDAGRGYILELLLAKVLYMSRKYALQIQVITMSATLANVELLKRWLDAELFITDFRPVALQEMIKVGNKIYDSQMNFLRDVTHPLVGEQHSFPALPNDPDHVAQLCLETLLEGCSVIVFCPSKDWCEKLSTQLAGAIHALGKTDSSWGVRLRALFNRGAIEEVKQRLRDIPTGLDTVLEKTISYACAFHHAGLTTEERDIVEASFKSGALKVIVATSTLSSGVNLPARRVLIRTPLFGGKQMNSLTYKQMIGRAGRTGKDTLGESILICTDSNARIGRDLITADLKPISSCLELDSSTHLKRALLEVISSGVATTKQDVDNFVGCTLLSAQKQLRAAEEGEEESSVAAVNDKYITEALGFLLEYEFVRLQVNEETQEHNYVSTRLGLACLASSMPPTDGLILFSELQKSRRCFVLESELHAVYLVTPYSVCYQLQDLDWLLFLDLWEKISPAMKKVGELVGVKESFVVRAMRGQSKLDYKLLQIHKRFYTALALQELVNEQPINVVACKYKCTRGMLQSLQQMSSTFAGIVTAFCKSLQWSTLSLIVSQFKERLFFGIHRDLIDLIRLPDLSHKRARTLYDAGITTLVELANSEAFTIEKLLYNALSFDSEKQHDNENSYEAAQRKNERNFYITGHTGLTVTEAAKLLMQEARQFVQYELGVDNIKWTQQENEGVQCHQAEVQLHISCEEGKMHKQNICIKRKSSDNLIESLQTVTPPKLSKSTLVEKVSTQFEAEGKPSRTTEVVSDGRQEQTKNALSRKELGVQEKNCNIKENAQSNCINNLEKKEIANRIKETQIVNSKNDNKNCKLVQVAKSAASKANKSSTIKSPNMAANGNVNNGASKQQNNINIAQNSRAQSEAESSQVIDKKRTELNDATAGKDNNPLPNSITFELRRSVEIKTNDKKTQHIGTIATNKEKFTPKHFSANTTNLPDKPLPRRSPRNHLANSKRLENAQAETTVGKQILNCHKSRNIDAHFLSDDSFELHIGIKGAFAAANMLNVAAVAEAGAPVATSIKKPISPALNKSGDEIPSSQNLLEAASTGITQCRTPYASRLLRSYRIQGLASPSSHSKPTVVASKISANITPPEAAPVKTHTGTTSSSTIELSNMSIENSLLKPPRQLNASHILSCSKVDTAASHFNCVNIIDICGNRQLFVNVFGELMAAKRFGFCLGLQQQPSKRKPIIGANLLINQVAAAEQAANSNARSLLFQIDDATYLAGVAFSISDNVVFYMHMQEEGCCDELNSKVKCQYLHNIISSAEYTLLTFDAKEQLKMLRRAIPDLTDISANLEDPKVANWLLQPDKALTLQHMAQQFAPECAALVNICGSGRGYSSYGLDASNAIFAKVRCSIEACVTGHILQGQIENLERIGTGQLYKFFNELEMPLQLSLCNMEIAGFPVNEAALRKLFAQMLQTLKKLETKIYELHGTCFNLGSSTAVARVLGIHRKSNGRVSTSRQILEKIDSPISQLIIGYRKLSVALTKNVQPLLKCIANDRIHGQSITYTATGRISMSEPSLQNVAKDFEIDLGTDKVEISCRGAFFPIDTKRCLISSDFCQLEMRILAHLSQDTALLQVMTSEKDVFIAIASRWNKIAEELVSEQLRNGTKQICYAIVYGMGMRSLAEALKCTQQEAALISEQFHAAYPGIRAYSEKIVRFARNNGYIETITGRRRYLEHINSGEPHIQHQAERQAVNSTIQGSAADIAKSAILRMEKHISKYRQKLNITADAVRLVLHLHDELIFEAPEEKARKIAKLLSVTMENCVKLSVPLKVRLKIGRSWGELKEIKL